MLSALCAGEFCVSINVFSPSFFSYYIRLDLIFAIFSLSLSLSLFFHVPRIIIQLSLEKSSRRLFLHRNSLHTVLRISASPACDVIHSFTHSFVHSFIKFGPRGRGRCSDKYRSKCIRSLLGLLLLPLISIVSRFKKRKVDF